MISLHPVALPPVVEPLEPPPHGVAFVEPCSGGRAVLIRRRGGMPHEQLVLDLATSAVRWRLLDDSPGGGLAWDVLLSPCGEAVLAWVNTEPGAPWRLLRPGRAPVDLRGFTGGRWAPDGTWFGGPGGAFDREGRRLSGTLPHADALSAALFHAGPLPDLLRYVHDGEVLAWDGRSAPVPLRRWHDPGVLQRHRLDVPLLHPVRFSRDGRYVAWSDLRSPTTVRVCDNDRYRIVEVPGPVDAYAWTGDAALWILRDGAVHRVDAATGRSTRLETPPDERPIALGGATDVSELFIGTHRGHLYRAAVA